MDNMIKTTKRVIPMCYAYTTPGVTYHDGYTKIGYTEHDVTERIREQTHTPGIMFKEEWRGQAVFDDGSGETFKDHDFHAYLRKNGIKQPMDLDNPYFDKDDRNEWFFISGKESKAMFNDFRENRGILKMLDSVMPYSLRKEQAEAVSMTVEYFKAHESENPEFLWNAKPRFGKTLSTYDLALTLGAEKVLIVTNRPAIGNSWYQDYERFIGTASGFYFISGQESIKDQKYVLSYDEYCDRILELDNLKGIIYFISLQNLKDSVHFGGKRSKLKELAEMKWDLLVIDEAHEAVDTTKTDVAFNHIHRKYTLHLSGTPFKALANDKFGSDAIFNWSYADEQRAKRDWDNSQEIENPYLSLPELKMLTYKMSDAVRGKIEQGADFNEDGDSEAFFYDMNEFFKTNESGDFIHNNEVDKFLDVLTTQKKFPFSEEYREELKHTLWLVGSDVPTRSAKALVKKLKAHPVFKNYHIVPAYGDGSVDIDENDNEAVERAEKNAYKAVTTAIKKYDKTITVSVGKLTTGITVPEWTAVMMLSNTKSAALYMQAVFRAQNPCLFREGNESYRKETAYVFDFDPARTLDIFEQFANGLSSDTASGKGDSETRKKKIKELLNFFPVYGEDEEGEMIELDAEKVLTIPRAIHAKEVVRKGFMCNFLFQNITNIFASPAVAHIINKMPTAEEPVTVTNKTGEDLGLTDDGDVSVPNELIIGRAKDIFGDKIYSDVTDDVQEVISNARITDSPLDAANVVLDGMKEALHSRTASVIEQARSDGEEISKSTQLRVARDINNQADKDLETCVKDYTIRTNEIELERKRAIDAARTEGRSDDIEEINQIAERKTAEAGTDFEKNLLDIARTYTDNVQKTVLEASEKDRREKAKRDIEDSVRDHLRGFTRTIPSFLMAYGDENTTLENFDTIVPDEVFQEVTRNINTHECITLEDFRFLRDGGDYPDPNDPTKIKHFDGNLFEPIVFNDSIKEFLKKREMLADYFREDLTEDIFDYIPPQRTNQIFTPKKVVKQMVDYLEDENPNCFDNPDATFIDLYMKSGLYITEIVKRLYSSNTLIELYPNEEERLKHIFDKQVYGLAPTEIIYAISTHYILGFAKNHNMTITSEHFKLLDALPYAQAGLLEKKLDELFDGGPQIVLGNPAD